MNKINITGLSGVEEFNSPKLTFYHITNYVIDNGTKGFTNDEIKNDLGKLHNFEMEWKRFKNNARRNGKKGIETMYLENGKYHF